MPAIKFLKMVTGNDGFRSELGNVIGYNAADAGNVVYEV